MEAPRYVKWFVEESDVTLSDGTHLSCYRIEHTKDEDVLNDWAVHLRRHYESDESLSDSVAALGISKSDYLREYVLPGTQNLAAACRSGDFPKSLYLIYLSLYIIIKYHVANNRTEPIKIDLHKEPILSDTTMLIQMEGHPLTTN